MDQRTFLYGVDANDALVTLSEEWLAFARENRARELTREAVLGRSLWSFIAGRETRRLYEVLFERVRAGVGPLEIPFRCDSPDRFRFMSLQLDSADGRSVRCRGSLLREQERPFFPLLEAAFPRSEQRLSMCSLCKKLFVFGAKWLEAEQAIRELQLFDSAELPGLDYMVCDGCERTDPARRRRSSAA